MANEYIAPALNVEAFHCPLCGVYAHQDWGWVYSAGQREQGVVPVDEWRLAFCARCARPSFWFGERQVWPIGSAGPLPNEDLGEEVVALYNEARSVASLSSRSAAALLRLCTEMLVQRLCKESKLRCEDLNEGIGQLVKQGLPRQIQQSLDALRVIGNGAVHPGQMDLADDHGTVESLFHILNLIANDRITQPKAVESLYAKLPAEKKQSIESRDGKARE